MRQAVICTVLLLVTWGSTLQAQEATPVRLRVRPVLCLLDRNTASCDALFQANWSSEMPGNYCLRNEVEVQPLWCWNSADEGRYSDRRVVRETFSYWMAEAQGERRLVTVIVEVMRIDSDDRRRSRRSRHVWDVL